MLFSNTNFVDYMKSLYDKIFEYFDSFKSFDIFMGVCEHTQLQVYVSSNCQISSHLLFILGLWVSQQNSYKDSHFQEWDWFDEYTTAIQREIWEVTLSWY